MRNKYLICQWAHVVFQYIYKYNVTVWRESERLNLLRRQARNHFLLTHSVLLCSKHHVEGSKFHSLQPVRLLHVFTKKRMYFYTIFTGKWKLPLTQRYHEQYSDCLHNSQIYIRRVKIKNCRTKFLRVFSDAAVNRRTRFSSFWFNKNDKNSRIVPFIQLYRFVKSEPIVVVFIARRAVYFVRPKSLQIERPTVW